MINAAHGGNDLGLDVRLDLSANLNPMGMSESVRAAAVASADDWERYPDPLCRELRKKLSEKTGADMEKIVCGNGADDLIYRTASALKPHSALICAPTFGEYGKALRENGCNVREHILRESENFALTERILGELSGVDMAVICTPNNPTGMTVSPELMAEITAECEKNRTYLLVDESFIGFTGRERELTALNFMGSHVIVLRSFTKIFAMAGLRLGYAVCGSADTAGKIAAAGQYWSVSAPAQAAGIAALDEEDYVRKTAELIAEERKYLSCELSSLGCKVYPSEADYILFRSIPQLGERLLGEGILIRSCGDYSGLDGSFFRTAVGLHGDNEALICAVRRCIDG
ncbi:histidinol-phosphate transaminase [Ruminococcus sp.]|uniref:pyridoxal phosphate-dependent aminotransferase n=1 Tax=Ruminococcus sp. TaxID=41978 RepID=UPI002B80B393|nr:histidinol-phosphate transaminase [Ruminococcus sp.]HNZ98701.1 histidinol-phosphate transaminase [Ruminococcus sp.]